MMSKNNPFMQAKNTFYVEFETLFQFLYEYIPICEKFSDNIVYFEKDGSRSIESMPEDLWQVQIYFHEKSRINECIKEISSVAKALNLTLAHLSEGVVDDIDWVSEVQKNFKPIIAEKFYIHNESCEIKQVDNKISIEINAGRAFGTGEHATTSNCLKALSSLEVDFNSCLDMGCGSGILAIAMKKLGAKKVVAVDVDEQAVEVTRENFILNKIDMQLVVIDQSNGGSSPIVKDNGPYDVITANILARPLIEMAQDLLTLLKSCGTLITAGFINSQVEEMILAYEAVGFKYIKKISDDNWPVLIFSK